MYGIVVLSMSLLAGWGGVWSVGQPALFAIGAYTAVHGSAHGWSLELIVLVACGLAAVAGGFLGFAGARFSVLYISLLTLAFNLVVARGHRDVAEPHRRRPGHAGRRARERVRPDVQQRLGRRSTA